MSWSAILQSSWVMPMLKSINARMNAALDPWLTSRAMHIIPWVDLCTKYM